MDELIKGIRKQAEKMKYEMSDLFGDMEDEFKVLKEIVKEKTEKLSDEIKKRIR